MRHLLAIVAALLLITPAEVDPVRAFMATHGVPGMAVAMLDGGQVTQLTGYGVRSAAGEPVTPRTQFLLGPGVPLFTQEAARRLSAQGRLHPSQPISALVPCYTGHLTVGEALNAPPAPPSPLLTLEDQRVEALQAAACEADAPPAVLLGAAVANAHGTSYERALEELVFAPEGMTGSTARPRRSVAYSVVSGPVDPLPQMADGHRRWLGVARPEPDLLTARVMAPAGMAITTAEDAARLLPTLDEPVWQVGYAPHFSSVLVWLPDEGRGVVLLANVGLEPAALTGLAEQLLGTPAPSAPPAAISVGWGPLLALVWPALSVGLALRRPPAQASLTVALPLLVDAGLVAAIVALSPARLDLSMLYDPAGTALALAVMLGVLACGFGRSAYLLRQSGGAATRPITH